MSDELDQWMTAARDHADQGAFAQVVEACHHLLRASVLRETADAELADEIAQEALVRAWSRRQQYRPGTSPRAWLLAITRSQLIEHHRRRGRDRRHLDQLVQHELLRHRQDEDRASGPSDGARIEALHSCLAQLSDDARHLLAMVHEQGMTSEMAAAELGISPAACRQRLSRLQRSLRTNMEQQMGGGDS